MGRDILTLVGASPRPRRLGDPTSMFGVPPERSFCEVVRAEALPALRRCQQVEKRCACEFAMELRELALCGEGGDWWPASPNLDDLGRGASLPLNDLVTPAPLEKVFFFAIFDGERGVHLQRAFIQWRSNRAENCDLMMGMIPARRDVKVRITTP